MKTKLFSCNFFAGILLVVLSFIALLINFLIYQYPGNTYINTNTVAVGLILIFCWIGSALQFGVHKKLTRIFKEVFFFYLVLVVISFASTAVQFTPFAPIDEYIMAFETALHIDMETIIAWTSEHPNFKDFLAYCYDTLSLQLAFLPLIIIVAGQTKRVREFYFQMIMGVVIGYIIYYFFPTTAPASIIDSPHFYESQKATGLKFYQIHNYIQPTTYEGGMIAFPSFHIIWAWNCQYLIRGWHLAFALLLPLNLCLALSCVLLGWHYPVDIVGSIFVILIVQLLYRLCQNTLSKIKQTYPLENFSF
ncbi:phosphatase PAP2 family protein [Legionella yabuuchiae]|uniref:phosphatase PAP2 family protein n=1 Tax=Legionella yabuuchiae TaxID=376727 RepID=UPI001055FD30|nr:phosphatase PAP2 family protein [Legionella yabuuchiae]